ncbi:ATP-dependent helicase [Candidatus Pacearchaeota archaeon]|nr:ATP-dependent helicase [Candidatus Pacearchaeota archaeon]
MAIIIDESFSEDDSLILDKVEQRQFESADVAELKASAAILETNSEISGLIAYDLIKHNLAYQLPYQSAGALHILKEMNGSALLADEVGLGKTITTGIFLKECIVRGFVNRALILTPPSLVDQWVAELHDKFNLDFKIIENENDWDNVQFAIASIDRVKTFDREKGAFRHEKAHNIPWDVLIVDEAHKLKQRNTTRWRFVDRMQKKRFLLLTATPFQNDLLELYNLLHLLKRGHLGTINEFREKFLFRGNKRYPLNPVELRKRLQEVMLRRRRDETGIDYKKRIPKIEIVYLTKEEKNIYDSICDLLKTKYFSANGDELRGKLIIYAILPKVTSSSRSAVESLTKIAEGEQYHAETRQLAQDIIEKYSLLKKDSKIEKLIEIVDKILHEEPNAKILMYTKHPSTLRYIVEKLKPYNLKIVEFIGGLEREEKTLRINQFKKEAQVMISTETGAEGLNFQFCNYLINYDLPWNPMSVEQRIGRLDRIGQTKDMYIYSLATKDTMEEHVVDLIINKMCCIGLVIGELPTILFNLGLDGQGNNGVNKIEEMLMNSFIDSKNNLEIFAQDVSKISEIISKGLKEYNASKEATAEVLDQKSVSLI